MTRARQGVCASHLVVPKEIITCRQMFPGCPFGLGQSCGWQWAFSWGWLRRSCSSAAARPLAPRTTFGRCHHIAIQGYDALCEVMDMPFVGCFHANQFGVTALLHTSTSATSSDISEVIAF